MATNPIDPNASANAPHTGEDQAPGASPQKHPRDPATSASPLEELARQHGQSGVVGHRSAHKFPLLDDMRAMRTFVREATSHFRGKSSKEPLSYAAEWMLDNYYLVEQSLRQTREDLPPGFYRQLPKLAAGPLESYPRIYAVAQELVASSGARLDVGRIQRFV